MRQFNPTLAITRTHKTKEIEPNLPVAALVYGVVAGQRLTRGDGAPEGRPSTARSSSISAQWIPKPAPALSQFSRSEGWHVKPRIPKAAGAEIERPSAEVKQSVVLCAGNICDPFRTGLAMETLPHALDRIACSLLTAVNLTQLLAPKAKGLEESPLA